MKGQFQTAEWHFSIECLHETNPLGDRPGLKVIKLF